MAEPCKNYTYKLDDLTNTRLEWLVLFSKHIGVPKATKRIILTRAIEVYLECMEAEVAMYNMSPKNKEIIQERTALLKAAIAKESRWKDSHLPKVKLEEGEVFPTYADLSSPKVPLQLLPIYKGKRGIA